MAYTALSVFEQADRMRNHSSHYTRQPKRPTKDTRATTSLLSSLLPAPSRKVPGSAARRSSVRAVRTVRLSLRADPRQSLYPGLWGTISGNQGQLQGTTELGQVSKRTCKRVAGVQEWRNVVEPHLSTFGPHLGEACGRACGRQLFGALFGLIDLSIDRCGLFCKPDSDSYIRVASCVHSQRARRAK